jgi:hypothetical protein
MRTAKILQGICTIVALLASPVPLNALAAGTDKARIGGLSDVAFGTISNFSIDQKRSQSICIYSSSASASYNVTAYGSGNEGAFTLASGSGLLAYEVEWSGSSGQTTGIALTPNVPLAGLTSAAANPNCNPSPSTSASLVVVLRAAAVVAATAGSYSGTLTLIVGPT